MSDLVIDNARIWTGWEKRPWASRLAIRDGRVAALDDDALIGGEVIDAGGSVVTPGLIDAHMHLALGGQTLQQLDLSHVRSRQEFEQAIARHNSELPAGAWLIANGWSEENWAHSNASGATAPDRHWLSAAGNRPAVCYRMDLHAAVVNDAVLSQIDTTDDPPGGTIVRDEHGRPSGLLLEAALWDRVNPLIPSPDDAMLQSAIRAAMRHVNSFGLTSAGSMEYRATVERGFVPLRDELTLRVPVTLLDRDWSAEEQLDTSFADSFDHDDRLRIIGFKAFADGTMGSRTAALLEPYSDDPATSGLLVELAERGVLNQWARFIALRGYSPSIHAIGDRAVRMALDAIEGIAPSSRPRIEHAQQIDAADIPRFAGRIASMQPQHKADDGRYLERRLGRHRLAGTFAFRSLKQAGAILAFGSDWPVVTCDPVAGMRCAITGLTNDGKVFLPKQNLTVEETLRAYTVDTACALQLDRIGVGMLRPGAAGDAVIFNRDPFTADWIGDPPRVITTVFAGRVVWSQSR